MDILHLVDRLEELFNESRPVPLTHSVMVDEERILDIIDQMRVSIPEEIKKAQQLTATRDRLIAQAKEEADRITTQAREKAEAQLNRDSIIEAARVRDEQMKEQARIEIDQIRREADEYVIQTLSNLEAELDRNLSQVRNGIRSLQNDHNTRLSAENRTREAA